MLSMSFSYYYLSRKKVLLNQNAVNQNTTNEAGNKTFGEIQFHFCLLVFCICFVRKKIWIPGLK